MEPLKENLDAIVMEFKVQNTSKEKSLEETVEHALRQIQEKQYDNTSIYVVGFPNANMDHMSIGSGYQEGAKPGGSFDVTRLVGFVGNLGYTYDNRFLLDASVRSDGSSIYGSNNRWGTFWSVGVGKHITVTYKNLKMPHSTML